MSSSKTFVGEVLQGHALITDIDEWVAAWHDSESLDHAECSLSDYLGLTPEEYAIWVERPEVLRFAIKARRSNSMSSAEVEEIAGLAAAAARSGDDAEAAGVIHWLRETGRLPEKR